MTPYADSAYYKNIYCGALSPDDFDRLSHRASAFIEAISRKNINLTDGSMSDMLCAAVKNACCAVAEAFFRIENGGGIVKESNDGVSVTYRSASSPSPSPEAELLAAAKLYLLHTGLLYSAT